jgi:ribosomal protein S12
VVEKISRFKKQHFLNQFEQNNRFKKCTQGASPKNSTLQGASQKKKITVGKNKICPHYREL